ncbi:MAG: transcriptional regulator [Thermodesulfobacteriota bacterium]
MSTVRQRIIALLTEREMNAGEISREASIREREVYDHLQHIARSLAAAGAKMVVSPYACLTCGYLFSGRHRLSRPGRCPRCRNSHIRMATYRIEGGSGATGTTTNPLK